MSDGPLTAEEIRALRSLLKGLSVPEWRALKAIANGIVRAMGNGAGSAAGSSSTNGAVASDFELNSKYGDPTVRKDPKNWAGASYVGAKYSECPSEYLLELAGLIEWMADKDSQKPEPKRHRNGTPYYELNRKDAARARGWAARNHGKDMPPPKRSEEFADDPGTVDDYAQGEAVDSGEDWSPT